MGHERIPRPARRFWKLPARQAPLCFRHERIDELCRREIADQWRGLARPKRQKRHTRRIAVCLEQCSRETGLSRELQHFRIRHFVDQAIAERTRGSTSENPRQSGVFVCGPMEAVAVDRRDHRFWTSEKRGADLNAARPQSECGGDTAAISDATGSDHGHAHGIHHLRDESHRADQSCAIALGKGSAMTACLEALGDDGAYTFGLKYSRLANCRRRA